MQWKISTVAAAVAAITWATPQAAQACGGTFCDAGPQVMPVDQTGENVLFVMEQGWVEAHIQIQYSGDPEQFAWIVPVMAAPEISVGSQPLFDALLTATVPTFQLTQRSENCGGMGGNGGGVGCGDGFALSDFAAGGDGEEEEGPDVLARDVVGSYEYAVLEGGTVDGVVQWLDDNGFAQDDDAPPILGDYLADGFLFVAFKLRAGAGLDEIHPIVVRYPGDEPCVPLRLTRIAAKEDMGVRAFFLGDGRVVPTNYRHVELNPLRIDWAGLGSNYEEVVSLAVDEEGADGHGFVTEYAGASSVVDTTLVHRGEWDSEAFLDFPARDLTNLLERQGLLSCFDSGLGQECGLAHPLVGRLLQDHFPAPEGVPDDVFYACTGCVSSIDETDWDREGFAAAFQELVIAPGQHALFALSENPYLTRLYTTISPAEMTEDPLFHVNTRLPDVDNVWRATQVNDCEGPDRLELADGRVVWFDDVVPIFDDMPASVLAEEVPAEGAPMVLATREADIDATLQTWNDEHAPAASGCDCRAPRRGTRGAWTFVALVLLGLRARRRPRPRRLGLGA